MLIGPPAAGKGTQAEMIQATYGIPTVSPGEMLRSEIRARTELGMKAEQLTSEGRLLPDAIVIELMQRWLATHDGEFACDGFPRTVGQAEALAELLNSRRTPLQVAICLTADLLTLQHRVEHRLICQGCRQIVSVGVHVASGSSTCPKCGGELKKRADDTLVTLANRMEEYTQKTVPLIDYYRQGGLLQEVDSQRPPEEVFTAVVRVLES